MKKNGDLDLDRVVILKPDAYYNTKIMSNPPKSVDGIVIVDDDGDLHFYIAELKSSSLGNIKKKEIQDKFETVFTRFLTKDFSHIFIDMEYNLKKLNLWLVCDPLRLRKNCGTRDELIRKARAANRLRSLLAEYAHGLKPYSFKGHTVMIKPLLSPPKIEQKEFIDMIDEDAA